MAESIQCGEEARLQVLLSNMSEHFDLRDAGDCVPGDFDPKSFSIQNESSEYLKDDVQISDSLFQNFESADKALKIRNLLKDMVTVIQVQTKAGDQNEEILKCRKKIDSIFDGDKKLVADSAAANSKVPKITLQPAVWSYNEVMTAIAAGRLTKEEQERV